MTRIEERIGVVLRTVTVVLLSLILALMVANVLNRFVHFAGLDWNDEIIELMLAWMIFTGSAEVWRMNQHFAVDLVPQLIAGTAFEKAYKLFLSLGCLVFITIFTYRSYDLFQRASDVSPYFSLSRRLWLGAMPVNGALMVMFSLRQFLTLLLTPAGQHAAARAAAAVAAPEKTAPTR